MERITRDEVMRAARDFGAALFECKELKTLKQTEEAFQKNKEARDLLSSYQTRQRFLQMARMRGKGLPDDEMAELKNLEIKVNTNALIKNFVENSQAFQQTMRNLNTEISGLLGIDFSANSRSGGGCC